MSEEGLDMRGSTALQLAREKKEKKIELLILADSKSGSCSYSEQTSYRHALLSFDPLKAWERRPHNWATQI